MKEVTWMNVDAVWFEVELFKVKDVHNPVEDLDAIQNTEYHLSSEVFPAGTARDAGYLAEALLIRDDGYNYALIYLCRYNSDPEISEGRKEDGSVNERTLIGDAWSEEKASGSGSDPKK